VPSLEPIGTIRAYKVDLAGNSYYKLSRLVVLKEYRHYGFGGNLVLALHNWVKDDARQSGMVDCAKVVCHSQAVRSDSAGAVAFYRKYDVINLGSVNFIWTHRLVLFS
jgi:ribosomal protein S18 acetylase RimI-like enzyme